jgi:hypothetical protein
MQSSETKWFTPKTVETMAKLFGDLAFFENKKVFHSSLVYSYSDSPDKTYIINKDETTPTFAEDWYMYLFLRAYCHGHLTTGMVLRGEKNLDSYDEPNYGEEKDIEKYYYYGNSEAVYDKSSRPKKPIFVMSNGITPQEIQSIPVFTKDYACKIVKSNPILDAELQNPDNAFQKFTRENQIEIVKDAPLGDIEEALRYLLNERKLRSVLVEAGTSVTGKLYEEDYVNTPIDVLVLSVYSGKLRESCVGKEFPSFSKILKKFKLAFKTAPIPSVEGHLIMYTFVKLEESPMAL